MRCFTLTEQVQHEIEFEKIFDEVAYNRFLELADISNVIEKENVLVNLDCGLFENKFYLNNAGILFFSNDPMRYVKQGYIVCALYKGLDKVTILDRKDIKGNIIDMIEESFLFVQKHINLRYKIDGIRRTEILDIPEVALREAIINAICHRDYFEHGAQVMIEVFDDRVVISNPGGIPKGLGEKNFGKLSMVLSDELLPIQTTN